MEREQCLLCRACAPILQMKKVEVSPEEASHSVTQMPGNRSAAHVGQLQGRDPRLSAAQRRDKPPPPTERGATPRDTAQGRGAGVPVPLTLGRWPSFRRSEAIRAVHGRHHIIQLSGSSASASATHRPWPSAPGGLSHVSPAAGVGRVPEQTPREEQGSARVLPVCVRASEQGCQQWS